LVNSLTFIVFTDFLNLTLSFFIPIFFDIPISFFEAPFVNFTVFSEMLLFIIQLQLFMDFFHCSAISIAIQHF
jgi:hypothetical protein